MPLMEVLYQMERAKQVTLIPFFYSTQFVSNAVAVGTTATNNIQIQSDSHFVVRYLNITVYNSPNILVFAGLAALTLNLFDTGSGRTLFDNPQSIQNVMGGVPGTQGGAGGNAPFIFPEPWLVRAGATIQVSITNLGQLTFPRVDVSMPGIKAFKFGANSPADMSAYQ
jgi:hypothetical protein